MHCAFIGTNGTGKSTLVDMILHPDNYLYDGRLIVDVPGRIGYVSQFYSLDEEKEVTVFDYLSEEFVRLQKTSLQRQGGRSGSTLTSHRGAAGS